MVQIMVFKIMDLWEMTQIEYCLGDEIADKVGEVYNDSNTLQPQP